MSVFNVLFKWLAVHSDHAESKDRCLVISKFKKYEVVINVNCCYKKTSAVTEVSSPDHYNHLPVQYKTGHFLISAGNYMHKIDSVSGIITDHQLLFDLSVGHRC